MTEEYGPIERQQRLLAREKAHLCEVNQPADHELSNVEFLQQDIDEEREKRGMYANPLLAGAVITQFFATVAANDTASYGCTALALMLMIFGVKIYVTHTRRINRLKAKRQAANASAIGGG